jgi:hypothetical protein
MLENVIRSRTTMAIKSIITHYKVLLLIAKPITIILLHTVHSEGGPGAVVRLLPRPRWARRLSHRGKAIGASVLPSPPRLPLGLAPGLADPEDLGAVPAPPLGRRRVGHPGSERVQERVTDEAVRACISWNE